MAILRVSLEEARDSDLTSLGGRVKPDAVWEGKQATSYAESYERWQAAEKNLIQAQRELGQRVEEIIARYAEIEGGNYFPA